MVVLAKMAVGGPAKPNRLCLHCMELGVTIYLWEIGGSTVRAMPWTCPFLPEAGCSTV